MPPAWSASAPPGPPAASTPATVASWKPSTSCPPSRGADMGRRWFGPPWPGWPHTIWSRCWSGRWRRTAPPTASTNRWAPAGSTPGSSASPTPSTPRWGSAGRAERSAGADPQRLHPPLGQPRRLRAAHQRLDEPGTDRAVGAPPDRGGGEGGRLADARGPAYPHRTLHAHVSDEAFLVLDDRPVHRGGGEDQRMPGAPWTILQPRHPAAPPPGGEVVDQPEVERLHPLAGREGEEVVAVLVPPLLEGGGVEHGGVGEVEPRRSLAGAGPRRHHLFVVAVHLVRSSSTVRRGLRPAGSGACHRGDTARCPPLATPRSGTR